MFLDTYYEVRYRESSTVGVFAPDKEEVENPFFDPYYWVCTNAAKTICFADCSDEEVIKIVAGGETLHYRGWMPNMRYEFESESGNVVYSRCFPSWDH